MLASTLSACALMSMPAKPATLFAPNCFTEIVEASGLETPTEHATAPNEPTMGAWIDYGNRETGQVDKANADKRAIVGIGKTCDKWMNLAKEKVERRKFLGIF